MDTTAKLWHVGEGKELCTLAVSACVACCRSLHHLLPQQYDLLYALCEYIDMFVTFPYNEQ